MTTQTGGFPEALIEVRCAQEIAFESKDHTNPWGAKCANGGNQRFNDKLYKLYPLGSSISVLDIGCAGGLFVKNCLDDGHLAIGLEGTDYCRKWKRAEWRLIPEYLFCADVTKEVNVSLNGKRIQFDVITAWEFFEHIKEQDLPGIVSNIRRHLKSGGICVFSISARHDIMANGVDLHETVMPKAWWIEKFQSLGLAHLPQYERYFNTQYVRGQKQGYCGSFHIVVGHEHDYKCNYPKIPYLGFFHSLVRWCYDKWLHTELQKVVAGTAGNMNMR